jgi:hypothetical protein
MSYKALDTFATYHTNYGEGSDLSFMRANNLANSDVFNHKYEGLGSIKEFILNMQTGEVGYAVLSYGGILGIAERLFAVPFKALVLDIKNKRFILKIEKDKIQNAPGFVAEHWPNMADKKWNNSIHDYYSKACVKG